MKKLLVLITIAGTAFLFACGGGNSDKTASDNTGAGGAQGTESTAGNPSYDPERGEGKFNADNVKVSPALDAAMAASGEKVYNLKCASCHKLSEEKLVGPGWKDVTKRHKPEWIMNFVTNTDEMLNKDPKAQAQLEICMVRMPNQSLNDQDARAVFEFQRRNDGVK